MAEQALAQQERRQLLDIAARAIDYALRGAVLAVDPDSYGSALQRHAASFVTLRRAGELRGCIGGLTARQPLVLDVRENAAGAALRDPRFYPLRAAELVGLEIHVSVLSAPVPLTFRTEAELLAQLRPGIDGLLLEAGAAHRSTFLPSVWDTLGDPVDFLAQLKRKAGLPADYWSPDVCVSRYTTESFS